MGASKGSSPKCSLEARPNADDMDFGVAGTIYSVRSGSRPYDTNVAPEARQ